MTQVRQKEKARRVGWVLFSALIVAALALTAIWLSLRDNTPLWTRDDAVWVNDGANIVPIVPTPGVAVNTLSPTDFTAAEDGTVRYAGTDHVVLQGIDVSEHQGIVDWQQVADSGVKFAYVRLGYRGTTEGGVYADTMFEENLSGACNAGLSVGVYFFSQAIDEREAAEEAEYLLCVLGERTTELPVMFDWEVVDAENARSAGVDGETLHRCALVFCRRIQQSGRTAGIYFNRQQGYYCYDLAELNDCTLWVSDLNAYPDFYYAFSFWQYSFSGSVPGINGAVDRDLWFIPIQADG